MSRMLFRVLFVGAALAPLAAAFQAVPGVVKKVRTDFAFVQTNAPVQVMGLRSTIHDFAEQVHVANVAAKKVVRLQLGWTVDGCGKSPARTSFLGLPLDLDLAPGAWTSAGRQGITPTDVYRVLNQLRESCGEIQVGVVFVQFADGTQWTYPLALQNRFAVSDAPEVIERLEPALREMREKSGSAQSPTAGVLRGRRWGLG